MSSLATQIWIPFLLLYVKFWDTCAERAGLLHRYTCAMVVCCSHQPVIYIRYFSWFYPPHVPPLPDRPQCVMSSSLSPCVLIVQHPLMSKNIWCLVFCSCVSWEWWFPDSSMFLKRTWIYPFLWLHSIPWCICATFFQSSLLSMGIWVDSRSLLL